MNRNRPSWRRWRRIFRRNPADEVDAELRHHVEERVRDYIDRGMDADRARSAALERLGDLESARAQCVDLLTAERRLHDRRVRLTVSWLDVKLGIRMLAKYPGLSVISVLGMAVAIAIAAGYFGFFSAVLDPGLPLEGGDRIVSIRNVDIAAPGREDLEFAHDYGLWRDALKSVTDLGAFQSVARNLVAADGSTELVTVARMTVSGFALAGVPAVLGRTLTADDERPGVPPVLVIAHEEWQRRFQGDRDIVGTTVQLGGTVHTIVGVMPEGFRFPIRHRYWAPLKLDAAGWGPGGGPPLNVFGRLADGFSINQARAELATLGRQTADAFRETHEYLRPRVMPYTWAFFSVESPEIALAVRAVQIAVGLLLVIVAVNVAILVYARTVTRIGEISVRTALGASRRRVVSQLFVEALILSVASAVIGLTLASTGLRMTGDFQRGAGDLPFWMDPGLTPGLIGYVLLLAIVAGGIVGVVPAFKATGHRMNASLQQLSVRGSSMQLGRTWTVLIIVQVAVAVAALPAAVSFSEQALGLGGSDPAPAADDLLRATLVIPDEASPTSNDRGTRAEVRRARYEDRVVELIERLEAEPAVTAVTVASAFPGLEPTRWLEADGTIEGWTGEPPVATSWARINRIAPDLFTVFDVPILAGRPFVEADAREASSAVIVNEAFASRIGGGLNVVGRAVRYAARTDDAEPGPWLEIVGVVPDFAHHFVVPSSLDGVAPQLFHAGTPGMMRPSVLVVRVRGGEAAAFSARLRNLAAAVDPALVLERLESVGETWRHSRLAYWYAAIGLISLMASVLLLSAAGIYALMSFTVNRRRREIGIRSALGANPRRLLMGIFARASGQLGAGVLAGLTLAAAFEWLGPGGTMGGRGAILLPAVAALMVTIGLVAALGPARRGLAVQPTEALREE